MPSAPRTTRSVPRTDRAGLPEHRVTKDAVARTEELIDSGKYDDEIEWSDAVPSADGGNAEIEKHGYEGYAAWHLAIDPNASEKTKGRHKFAYGGFRKVSRAPLIYAERASQNGHGAVERAADRLLQRLDRARSS